ncbi:MAG TPA: hypothetical protein VGK59_10900 [Ohtaekwangia sp.]
MAETKPKAKKDLVEVEHGIYISENTGGVYETTKQQIEPDAQTQQRGMSSTPWSRWGHDNNYPQRFIDTVSSDPSASLVARRAAMHYGKGMMFYEKKVEGSKEIIIPVPDEKVPSEISDFFFENDIPNLQVGIILDYEWFECFPINYILNPFGKVLDVDHNRMKDIRCEHRNPKTGNIDNYYLSGHWPAPKKDYYTTLPAFDRKKNQSGIYLHKYPSVDKDYYLQPAWHGITQWLYIAKKIPRWILANIDNSINLKYHVKIPLDYFLKRFPEGPYDTDALRQEAIQKYESELYKKIDSYLAGEKNVHKAFYSKVAVDGNGNVLPGWEIIPLDNKIQDEAWLRAYGTAAMAIISGNGMNPSLGGTILPNGLGSGSGSDLREQFNMYMQVMTTMPRQKTLEPWEFIKRRNNWPKELHLGYRDVILQTVDRAKGGFEKPNEEAPTSEAA